MFIYTHVDTPSALIKKVEEIKVEEKVEELVEKPVEVRSKKKRNSTTQSEVIKKVEETEDEVLSRWLKEEEEVNLTE